jgi:predicted HicB family RNase H-like nuclease
MMRFDRDLLKRVTAEAKRNGVSRSAWISLVLAQKLNEAD